MNLKIFYKASSGNSSKVLKICSQYFTHIVKIRVVGIRAQAWHQLVGTSWKIPQHFLKKGNGFIVHLAMFFYSGLDGDTTKPNCVDILSFTIIHLFAWQTFAKHLPCACGSTGWCESEEQGNLGPFQ